jgi:hypothetical protein
MRYLIVIGDWFFNKYGIKLFWSLFVALCIYNFYTWYQDPSGTLERVTTNLQNPWYWIPIVIISLAGIVILINFIKFYFEKKRVNAYLLDKVKESVLKSCEETRLMNGKEIPSDEDIDKYYRMYCKKFELDNKNQWTTLKPIPFEEFEKKAKVAPSQEKIPMDDGKEQLVINKRGGWSYLISMTSDMFSFDPVSGQSTMMRFRDYESMI